MLQQNCKACIVLRFGGERVQIVERNMGLQKVPAAQDEGVELCAGKVFGGGIFGGEVW